MPTPQLNGPTQWAPAERMIPLNVKALTTVTQPSFAAIADINVKLYESIAAFNSEWVRLLIRRFQDDTALTQHLATCKSLEQAQQIYVDFWTKVFADYQEEFGQLARLGWNFTFETSSAVQKHVGAISNETQLAA